MNEREDWEVGVDLFEKFGGEGEGGGVGSDSDDSGDKKKGGFYEGPEACREFLGERRCGGNGEGGGS